MKTRKKVLGLVALLLALLLVTSAIGCEAPKETTAPETTAPEETTKGAAEGETFLEREEGCRLLTLYWEGAADIETSDVWMWWDGKDGQGYLFCPCAYGFKCQVNVPEEVNEVGFIVRRNCSDPGGSAWGEATKDFEDDRFAVLTGDETTIYLKMRDGKQYTSNDGGKTLSEIMIYQMAAMISEREVRYTIAPAARFTSLDDVVLYDGDRKVGAESLSSLNNNVVTGILKLKEDLDITKTYELEIKGYGRQTVLPTAIFDSEGFKEKYLYDGDDLGAVTSGSETTFKVWAPTASEVLLNLFEAGDGVEAYKTVPMVKGEKGVFSATESCGAGTYYTYTVTTGAGKQEAVDPYAKAVGVNGDRGMVIDLDTTDPEGFAADTYYSGLSSYEDAVVWEVHVRDFSNDLSSSKYPGKYLAFTETGLTNASGTPAGIDYVKDLGITHIHLQPVYDFATVDERTSNEFNWGYDPKNYNAPEGSYSTDPFHGEVRVNEFKQMVQGIHNAGLGVVMDVVYNHTYDGNSNLNKIVPYYYYRYTAAGVNSNGSGCGNETASEREMFRKYMVDSVTYWAKEYHIDGFRFDLMALHDTDTMQAIEQALHAINPECLIYGEGWTGGTTTLMANRQTTQANINKITASEGAIGAIAVFNDAIRDGLKGSVFDSKDTGYVNGTASKMNAYKVIHGLTGGVKNLGVSWEVKDARIMNYMSCHDNLTLYDKLKISCPDATEEELVAMNKLGAAAVIFSKGTPFMLAGEEFLRSKDGDSNSYKSSDEVNNIDWDALTPDSAAYATALYYKQLIAVRKSAEFLKTATPSAVILDKNEIEILYEADDKVVGCLVLNPNDEAMTFTLPEGQCDFLMGSCGRTDGTCEVPAKSAVLIRVTQ